MGLRDKITTLKASRNVRGPAIALYNIIMIDPILQSESLLYYFY